MKKAILFMALATTVAFTSCSKDDDNSCDSCTAKGETIEICDNGDGSYTLTTSGGAETLTKSDLAGLTPKQLVEASCTALNTLP